MGIIKDNFIQGEKNCARPGLVVLAIMMFYIVMADFTLLTPAIQTVYDHFQSTTQFSTVLMSVSLTGIIAFPSSILFGYLYDKIGYKLLGVIGIAIVVVAGVFPYFFPETNNYGFVIVSRCIVGLGLGAVNPIGSALITRFFEGQARVRLLGIGNTVFYAAATVFCLISGSLATVGWNYVFLGYSIAIIPFIIALIFLKEPGRVKNTDEEAEKKRELLDAAKAVAPKIPRIAYCYCLLYFVYCIGNFTIVQLMSTMIAEFNIGSPFVAGLATSCFTIGGVIGGLVYPFVHRKFHKWTFVLVFVLAAATAIGLFVLQSLPAIMILSVIDGICNILLLSHIQERLGATCHASKVATANGIVMGLMNFGTFLGAYFITLVNFIFPGLGILGPRLITGIIYVAFIVGTIIAAARSPKLEDRVYEGVDPVTSLSA